MIRLRRNREDIFFKTMQTSTVLVILITGYASSVRTEGMDPVDLEFLEPGQLHDDQRLPTFAETESDKKILDQLLSKERYDSRVIPPSEGPVVVNFSVHLLSLASPDESSLNYEVEFLMRQIWLDPRLRYEDGSHPFLNALHHHDEMWIPDTYFIKHGDFKEPSVPPYIALRVYRNGTVLYILRRHLILSCQGNLEIFPFDDPLCSFSVESISYEKSRMLYQWTDDEATLRKTPSLSSLNAYLMENSTTVCPDRFRWRGNISCLRVEMIFTRDKPFYLTSVFIPGIILVTSSFISFWLEWNAVGSRVLLGVTTMLNFFTTSNKFRSTLPVVSKLTAMNVWDGVCMCFIYASLLEFITVNYIGRKGPRQKFLIRQDTDIKMDRVSVEAFPDSEPEASLDSKANGFTTECQHEPSHPISIAKRIDIISRRVFPLCFAIFLIFFFIQYKAFG